MCILWSGEQLSYWAARPRVLMEGVCLRPIDGFGKRSKTRLLEIATRHGENRITKPARTLFSTWRIGQALVTRFAPC